MTRTSTLEADAPYTLLQTGWFFRCTFGVALELDVRLTAPLIMRVP